jgi:hypothetical protein
MPPTQTGCPANGTGRAAVTAPLSLGNHQTLVYDDLSLASSTSSLKLHDTQTGQTKTLLSVSSGDTTAIHGAQVSQDGQYVLFVSGPKLQMIRMDGQGLQTLYCAQQYNTGIPNPTLSELLWSPNQQLAVFEEAPPDGGPAGPVVRMLNLSNGNVQTIEQSGQHIAIQLEAWHGNTQVYYTLFEPPATVLYNNVYAIDVTQPAGKNSKEVAPIEGNSWDMSLTPDGNMLVLNQSSELSNQGGAGATPNQPLPPSLISSQAANGGSLHLVYGSHVHATVQSCVYSDQAMLFVIQDTLYGGGPNGQQDGLWRINLNGTGLTRLTQFAEGGRPQLATPCTPWANVSRDGTKFAVVNYVIQGAAATNELYYGSLNGGTPTLVSKALTNVDTLSVVGWTTL